MTLTERLYHYGRLVRWGFSDEQATALADAGYGFTVAYPSTSAADVNVDALATKDGHDDPPPISGLADTCVRRATHEVTA